MLIGRCSSYRIPMKKTYFWENPRSGNIYYLKANLYSFLFRKQQVGNQSKLFAHSFLATSTRAPLKQFSSCIRSRPTYKRDCRYSTSRSASASLPCDRMSKKGSGGIFVRMSYTSAVVDQSGYSWWNSFRPIRSALQSWIFVPHMDRGGFLYTFQTSYLEIVFDII